MCPGTTELVEQYSDAFPGELPARVPPRYAAGMAVRPGSRHHALLSGE